MNDQFHDLNRDATSALARFRDDVNIVSAAAWRHSGNDERFVLERLRRDALQQATQAFTRCGEPEDGAWTDLVLIVISILHHRDRFLPGDDDLEHSRLHRFVDENTDAIELKREQVAS